MSLVSNLKKGLYFAALSSTLFFPPQSSALLNVNTQVGDSDTFPPTLGYLFLLPNSTFTILDDDDVGNTLGVSAANFITATNNALNFAGTSIVSGNIGASLLDTPFAAINLQGEGETVTFQGDLLLTDALNFSANTIANVADNIIITGVVDNISGLPNVGQLNFLGSGTVVGSIGITDSLNHIEINTLKTAGEELILEGTQVNVGSIHLNDDGLNPTILTLNNSNLAFNGNITVETSNLNILNVENASTLKGNVGQTGAIFNLVQVAENSDLTYTGKMFANLLEFQNNNTLFLGKNSIINGDIDTKLLGSGTLTFLNSGEVHGDVGQINAIHVSGNLGTTALLDGIINTDINFTLGAAGPSFLVLDNNTQVLGNIDSTVGPNIGAIGFVGNALVQGTIGANNAVNEILLTEAGSTIVFNNNVTVGAGNFNFFADNKAQFAPNVILDANVNNFSGFDNQGNLYFTGSGTVTGDIGATSPLNTITVEENGIGEILTLTGTTINTKTIHLKNTTDTPITILLDNPLMQINAHFTVGSDDVNVIDAQKVLSITGDIGALNAGFNLIKIAQNNDLNYSGNIIATTTQFQGNNNFNLADDSFIQGNVVTTMLNTGTLNFLGNGGVEGEIGELAAVNIMGGANTQVRLQGTINAATVQFAGGAVTSTELILEDGSRINGTLDNIVGPDVGSLTLEQNAEIIGSIGATNPLYTITLEGDGAAIAKFYDSVQVGSGNINFSGNATLEMVSDTLDASIDNISGIAGFGNISFLTSGTITGNIGATNPLNVITVNLLEIPFANLELTGDIVRSDIILHDDGLTPTTLLLNNPNMDFMGNIDVNTHNLNSMNVKQAISLTGEIGASTGFVKLLKIGENQDLIVNGDIYADNIEFQNDNKLFLQEGNLHGKVTTLVNNGGSVIFGSNSTIAFPMGVGLPLNTVEINANQKTVVLNNTIFANNTNIAAGTLQVNSPQSITGDLNVQNQGILSLGTGANPLLVNGDFYLHNGALYHLDLNSTATSGEVIATGTANVDSGAALTLTNPPLGQSNLKLPIVTGGVGSVINRIPVSGGNSLFLNYETIADVNNNILFLQISSVPIASQNKNAITQPISSVLDIINTTSPTGELKNILEEILTLTDANTLHKALYTLLPLIDGGMVDQSFEVQRETFKSIGEHITQLTQNWFGARETSSYSAGDDPSKFYSNWVKVFGQHAKKHNQSEVEGYHSNNGGVVVGADVQCNNYTLLGGAFSWSRLNVHHAFDSTTHADNYQLSLYGHNELYDNLYLSGMAAISYNQYEVNRHIYVGDLHYIAQDRFSGWQPSVKSELSYNHVRNNVHIRPSALLYYSHLNIPEYTESNTGNIGLQVHDQDYNLLKGGLGLKISLDIRENAWQISPEIHGFAYYDFIGERIETTTQFIGGGPYFVTQGLKPTKTNYVLGGGVSMFKDQNILWTLNYDYNFRSGYHAHTGFVRAKYIWG